MKNRLTTGKMLFMMYEMSSGAGAGRHEVRR